MSSLLIDRFQAYSGPTRLSDVNGGLWQSAVAQAKTLKVSKQPAGDSQSAVACKLFPRGG